MELKRGWWKRDGEIIYLAGEKGGLWYGSSNRGYCACWSNSLANNATYCGDGREPVEPPAPVQLCLGWWENGCCGVVHIVEDKNDGPYRWVDHLGYRYNDQGKFSRFGSGPSGNDLIKRRPDLDAKEAEEKQPDPRDAEIERLKERVEQLAYENMQLIGMKAELKNQLNNLRRLIGDH